MQSTLYISSSPFSPAEGVSEEDLENAVADFNGDEYSAELSADSPGLYRFEMGTMDANQNSIAEALGDFCERISPLVARPVEIMLRTDEMNDDRDQYFYAAADPEVLKVFQANQRIGRALECLGHGDLAARQALQQCLVPVPEACDLERPRPCSGG